MGNGGPGEMGLFKESCGPLNWSPRCNQYKLGAEQQRAEHNIGRHTGRWPYKELLAGPRRSHRVAWIALGHTKTIKKESVVFGPCP